jgi:hypothetical protein
VLLRPNVVCSALHGWRVDGLAPCCSGTAACLRFDGVQSVAHLLLQSDAIAVQFVLGKS